MNPKLQAKLRKFYAALIPHCDALLAELPEAQRDEVTQARASFSTALASLDATGAGADGGSGDDAGSIEAVEHAHHFATLAKTFVDRASEELKRVPELVTAAIAEQVKAGTLIEKAAHDAAIKTATETARTQTLERFTRREGRRAELVAAQLPTPEDPVTLDAEDAAWKGALDTAKARATEIKAFRLTDPQSVLASLCFVPPPEYDRALALMKAAAKSAGTPLDPNAGAGASNGSQGKPVYF